MKPRNRNFHVMLLSDGLLLALAQLGAFALRFEFSIDPINLDRMITWIPFIVPFKLVVFYAFKVYAGMWRYTSLEDLLRLIKASLVTTVFLIAVAFLFDRFKDYSKVVVLLDAILSFLFMVALRIGIRQFYGTEEKRTNQSVSLRTGKPANRTVPKRIIIVGANDSGEQISRHILRTYKDRFKIIGFVDDQADKQGRSVHDIPILGNTDNLRPILEKYEAEQVLISSGYGRQIRKIVESCKDCHVEYKILPTLSEMIHGQVTINNFRKVNYEDLLGRPPVRLDTERIRHYIKNRVILVTGCGGSIGSELCRQIVTFEPKTLVLVDASEEKLFWMRTELQHELGFPNYQAILGRVQNRLLMEKIFERYHPSVVFHAAAYKHVPLVETNPWEAVFNNVVASQFLMEISQDFGVDLFVLVSSDKAVRPTNVMGASKRIAELILESFQGSRTRYIAVRFGNVVGSSGSVVQVFERQIKNGGPITITHPEMTRYFMSVPEAVQLILQAGALGKGGEIFILKMGQQVKILEMAKDLIRFSGNGKELEIVFTGLREGEKLYEELITEGEDIVQTNHEEIMVLRSNGSINGVKSKSEYGKWLGRKLQELSDAAFEMNPEAIKLKIREIVPEYVPQVTTCVLESDVRGQKDCEMSLERGR